ncbi:MAG: hypothetical protein LBT47_13455 [Deltaproteobacteria bacterium]|nr:hypothetical protein [Deltaproteobacteria bacterium]
MTRIFLENHNGHTIPRKVEIPLFFLPSPPCLTRSSLREASRFSFSEPYRE